MIKTGPAKMIIYKVFKQLQMKNSAQLLYYPISVIQKILGKPILFRSFGKSMYSVAPQDVMDFKEFELHLVFLMYRVPPQRSAFVPHPRFVFTFYFNNLTMTIAQLHRHTVAELSRHSG